MADPPREVTDHCLRWLFSAAGPASLRPFGVASPPLVSDLPSVIAAVESSAEAVDSLRQASDGSVWHLEFESGSGSAARLARHHLAVVEHYPGRLVRTVVFWCRRRRVDRPLRIGQVRFRPYQVSVPSMDGDAVLDARLRAAARGEVPRGGDLLLLAMVPLMHNRRSRWEVLRLAQPIVQALDPHLARPLFAAMAGLAYNDLSPDQRARLEGVLGEMPIGQELFEKLRAEGRVQGRQEGRAEGRQEGRAEGRQEGRAEGRQEGRAEGRQEGRAEGRQEGRVEGVLQARRDAVLEAFAAHFGDAPTALRTAVAATEDPSALSTWHRTIVGAPDAAAALRELGL